MHLHELEDDLIYRVKHERYFPLGAIELMGRSAKPLTRGGRTTVEIGRVVEIDGEKTFDVFTTAQAKCSLKDNYSKKRGRDIALGRALLALRNPEEVARRRQRRQGS